ncbi:MAG: hypothetical protein JW727_05370 [Candidatus Aenigmarchaeota archaeon]|nr:hypothetical protein [Candidatus Aenigmarchaeota archaeon]
MASAICSYLGLSGNLCTILYNVLFPWIITFAMIFGLLIKLQIFGSDKTGRGVSGLIALSVGFFIAAGTPFGSTMGQFFVNTSVGMMTFLFVILGILLVIGLTNSNMMPSSFSGWKGIAVLVVIVLLAWMLLGGNMRMMGMSSNDLTALVIILVVVGGMWYFVGQDSGGPEKGGK